ncbi:unnamed protein product [Hyaloperonospora brassicae]|uniref:Elicitin-like protein n=1 Tax=Hyaloperonospora brassicae TaxID=162125 RepID=A0AAV0U693_HYABA|nr:unnamed protein product [Hyaloperonospora brassicae]
MNTHFALVAIALTLAASVNADHCNEGQQQAAFVSMSGLVSSPDLVGCASKSGFDLMSSKTSPNAAQEAAMCNANECHNLIKLVQNSNPPNCELWIPTSQIFFNVKAMADGFEPKCKSSTSARSIDEPIDLMDLMAGLASSVSEDVEKAEPSNGVAGSRTPVSLSLNEDDEKLKENDDTPEQDDDTPEQDDETAKQNHQTTGPKYQTGGHSYMFAEPYSASGNAPVNASRPFPC